jgi:SAM-dependent methyltransferase
MPTDRQTAQAPEAARSVGPGAGFNDFGEAYSRGRYAPQPGDEVYLHLSDLQLALRPRLERAAGVWLDFGAATSPYRGLMPRAELRRADIAPTEEIAHRLDYVLQPGRPCPAPDNCFDGILSTQVLEHTDEPRAYLADAFRMLRPGGELVLTTHGIWEDHPCPIDLYRWTRQGLSYDVASAGFSVTECIPVTCGARCLLELFTRELEQLSWRERKIGPVGRYFGVTGLLLGALRLYAKRRPQGLHRYADRAFAAQRVGQEDKIYTALLVAASKPA